MAERASGRGHLRREGTYLCTVDYELNVGEAEAFILTDGIIHVRPEEMEDATIRRALDPYEPLMLVLEEPLDDGTVEVTVRIEAYEGHRPYGRYQIRLGE